MEQVGKKYGTTLEEIFKLIRAVVLIHLFYTPTDYFEKLSVFAYYDNSDTLDALEFHNNSKLWFHQKELFSQSLESLIIYFAQIDIELEITDDGFDSKKYGIGAWVSCVEDAREQTAETIIVYKRDYYEEANFLEK